MLENIQVYPSEETYEEKRPFLQLEIPIEKTKEESEDDSIEQRRVIIIEL
tara:strand:- start:358 stop:507 length:150 start_codon:yes stop_codon:yes gene_type:complete